MTNEEAIERLKKRICCEKLIQHFCTDNCMCSTDGCEVALAIEALEKQIAKKPIDKTGLNNTTAHLYENCSIVVCPECRGRLKLKSKGKYCDKCGQAIDWSE